MTDAVSISNLALQKVGAKSISSLTENTTSGRACNRVYEQARDSELRSHPWGFARESVQIAADATNPPFGAAKRYLLPSDYLRILPTNGTNNTDTQDDFQIFGRFIHTNQTSPINLVYIKTITDENLFDALFVELLASRIAMDIAEQVTQSNSKIEAARQAYIKAQRDAKSVNAFERSPQNSPTDPWLNARL
jgi:hypothetical protein|tara:strand:+ start:318 stop:893 length:576 start_codon:yes stop_codon:yes gene_type:complete